jgi:hypothetical protein
VHLTGASTIFSERPPPPPPPCSTTPAFVEDLKHRIDGARLSAARADVLLNQIKAQAYERSLAEGKAHNFALALPGHLAEQAEQAEGALKSSYNLEFLGIRRDIKDRARRPTDRQAARLHPRAGVRLLLCRAAVQAAHPAPAAGRDAHQPPAAGALSPRRALLHIVGILSNLGSAASSASHAWPRTPYVTTCG